MKVITIGSCLSNITAAHLTAKYGFNQTHSIHHNRSDSILNYFIEKTTRQIPLELLNEILVPKAEFEKSSTQFLHNQYDENLGFHDLQNIKLPNQKFFRDIKENKYDVILIDNLMDVSSLLLYPTNLPEYSKSGLFLNLGFYENEIELTKIFQYGAFLTPSESVANHIKIISFLKIHQPLAKIFFLPYHHSTSKNDLDRQARIMQFYDNFKDWAFANDIYVIPPLNVDNSLMIDPGDWTHYKMHVYEALAGMIYLNLCCDLPKTTKKGTSLPSLIRKPENFKDKNPYLNLPNTSFWKRSISQKLPEDIDLVNAPKFCINSYEKIASAGSCFAQYIAKVLVAENYEFLITESKPETEEALDEGYGIFPARFGNIYTARQLRQLLDRSLGIAKLNVKPWQRSDGKYVDPLRPTIQESGFCTPNGVLEDATLHLKLVAQMFKECDVFIFTLGLTEGWVNKNNKIVVPVAPGVAGGSDELHEYQFQNFSYQECFDDLIYFVDQLKAINQKVKVILTVSPVPLVATYEDEHVLNATIYSKSVLRAAAGMISKLRDHVDYFPAYEFITGNFNKGKYFKENLRDIEPNGVSYVMSHFKKNYLRTDTQVGSPKPTKQPTIEPELNIKNYEDGLSNITCDEELLDKIYKR